jgi:hypothetical protein
LGYAGYSSGEATSCKILKTMTFSKSFYFLAGCDFDGTIFFLSSDAFWKVDAKLQESIFTKTIRWNF